jgi:hypothetical protein
MHAFVYFNLIFYESLTDKTRTKHINVSLICIYVEQYVFYFLDNYIYIDTPNPHFETNESFIECR